jgi:hypothetical protein
MKTINKTKIFKKYKRQKIIIKKKKGRGKDPRKKNLKTPKIYILRTHQKNASIFF